MENEKRCKPAVFAALFFGALLFCTAGWYLFGLIARGPMGAPYPDETFFTFSLDIFFYAPAFLLAVGLSALPLLISLILCYTMQHKPRTPWLVFAGCGAGSVLLAYLLQWPMQLAAQAVEYLFWNESTGLYTALNRLAYPWYAAAVLLTLAAAHLCLLLKVPTWARLSAMAAWFAATALFTWLAFLGLYYIPRAFGGFPFYPYASVFIGTLPGAAALLAILLPASRKHKKISAESAEGE